MRQDEFPFVRWFVGAHTSAAFNELDRHVLTGHSDETAHISEPEPDGDKQLATHVSRRELLIDSALAAHTLRASLGVERGSCLSFYMPNDVLAVVWIAADVMEHMSDGRNRSLSHQSID